VDLLGAGTRPLAGHELGVGLDVAERGEVRELIDVVGIDVRRGKGAGSQDGHDLAAHALDRRLHGPGDRAVDRRHVGGTRCRRARSNGSLVRGGFEQGSPDAAGRDGLRVQGAGREQRRRAQEQQPRCQHDGPVRAAALEHGAPERGRSEHVSSRHPCDVAFAGHTPPP
jgi:hypothetical protein